MNTQKLRAFIQLVLVFAFIFGALFLSQIMKSDYEPGMRNQGEERSFFAPIQTVENGSYEIRLQATGNVVALAEVSVVPEVSGRVISVSPSFFQGGSFQADSPLFVIDSQDFELEVSNREAEVAGAKRALDLERAEASAALVEWADQNIGKPAPDLVARKPQIMEAEASFKAAKARLSTAELALSRTRFQLPEDGRVLQSNVVAGQFVQAGVSYGRVFYSGQLEVEASLKNDDLKWVLSLPEAKASIALNHHGESVQYEGVLKRGIASVETETRFATVRFGFLTPPDKLVPGVFTNLTITGPRLEGVAKLPMSVLQPDGNLAYLDKENRLRHFVPEIVYRGRDYIIISNLEDGDRIVTIRTPGMPEGSLVNPVDTFEGSADA